ncbi:MAG: hypothetical protein ACREFH_05815 [Stellaceae bacterium]
MQKPLLLVGLLAATATLGPPHAMAKAFQFSKQLTPEQSACLKVVISISHWGYSPQSRAEMPDIAQVATVQLSDRRRAYVFVFEADGWCGTAGCPLLIGELRHDGICHLLYDGTGDTGFTVLHRRDHGYRRIYAPCEARFDGRHYQQLHEECPSPGVPR